MVREWVSDEGWIVWVTVVDGVIESETFVRRGMGAGSWSGIYNDYATVSKAENDKIILN